MTQDTALSSSTNHHQNRKPHWGRRKRSKSAFIIALQNYATYAMTASCGPHLQILSRRVALSSTTAVLPDMLFSRPLICLKLLHLGAIHVLHNLICLPFLKAETQTLMRIVLVIRLIFVVLDLDEIAVDGGWVERQGDEGVDGGCFRDNFECP